MGALQETSHQLKAASRKRKSAPGHEAVAAKAGRSILSESHCQEIVRKLESGGAGEDKAVLTVLRRCVERCMLDPTADTQIFLDSQLSDTVDMALSKAWQASNHHAERCEKALDAVTAQLWMAEDKIQRADRDIKSAKAAVATDSKSLCKDSKREIAAAKEAVKDARDEFEDIPVDVEEAKENKAKLERIRDQVFNMLRYVGGGREVSRLKKFEQIARLADRFDFDEDLVKAARGTLLKQPGCRGRFDRYVNQELELAFKAAVAKEVRLIDNTDQHREDLIKRSDEATARLATARERQQTLKTSIKYAKKTCSVQVRGKAAAKKTLEMLRSQIRRLEKEKQAANEARRSSRLALDYFRMLARQPLETN